MQRVIDLLLDGSPGAGSFAEAIRRLGRPKASGNRPTVAEPKSSTSTKRTMSAEGRARIAATQKKRWAASKASVSDRNAEKRTSPTKLTSKTAPPKPARTVVPATAQKNARTQEEPVRRRRRHNGSPPRKRSPGAEIPSTKSTAKKSTRRTSRQPAKQVAAVAAEP